MQYSTRPWCLQCMHHFQRQTKEFGCLQLASRPPNWACQHAQGCAMTDCTFKVNWVTH